MAIEKLDQTEIRDITDKIPSELPKPKIEPVKVDDRPNIDTMDSSLTIGEWLGRFWRRVSNVIQSTRETIADVAKIVTLIQTWWLPVIAMIGILVILFLTGVLKF